MATELLQPPRQAPAGRHESRAFVDTPAPAPTRADVLVRTLQPGLLLTFTVTIFLSATLLFLVQPMVGKIILPTLGGTPGVWNACMLFFQAALLAGYGYAHISTTWLGPRRQSMVHLAVLALPLVVLPIAIGRGVRPPPDAAPVLWLLTQLTLAAGLPFFVVSTTGPLLQKWFAGTGHPAAADPFFLYAASNAGSLMALLGYPLLVEPILPVAAQTELWSIGYWIFAVLIVLCALMTWRHAQPSTAASAPDRQSAASAAPPSPSLRAWWLFAAFVPSSLMLGVTTHITSNLAPVPLLWVLPLAIYLLTFILVFARSRPVPHTLMCRILPFLLPPLALITYLDLPRLGFIAIAAHLGVFFVAAMVCHGRLADSRPSARHLTEFYLWMSIGGVLGGVFNALIAPTLFRTIAEYPIAIILACLLLPMPHGSSDEQRERRRDVTGPAVMGLLAIAIIVVLRAAGWGESLGLRLVVFAPLALVCFAFKNRPGRFTLGMCVLCAALSAYCGLHRGRSLYVGRNFFGTKRVTVDSTGRLHVLIHGSTTHGKQFIDPQRRREPLTYYHRTGPLGDVMAAANQTGRPRPIAAVGLGAGSLAAYARKNQPVTFYEIDPDIVRVARNPHFFTFLWQSRGTLDYIVGDGRLTLGAAPDAHYGLIVLDAFSSDAIPTHLLTREALRLYVDKLAPGGLLAFHISNRYLDLEPLLGALAADAGLTGLTRSDRLLTVEDKADGKAPAIWSVLARDRADLARLAEHQGWQPLRTRPDAPVWTDQYTSLLSYMTWR